MNAIKRFLEWFTLKERLHYGEHKPPFFNEREVWWCSIGENVGRESNGKGKLFLRPVLVFRKLSNETFLGLPITTQDKKGTWYVEISQGGRVVNVILSLPDKDF